jgi:hypothetical protein
LLGIGVVGFTLLMDCFGNDLLVPLDWLVLAPGITNGWMTRVDLLATVDWWVSVLAAFGVGAATRVDLPTPVFCSTSRELF